MRTVTEILAPDQEEAAELSGKRAHLARKDCRLARRLMDAFIDQRGPWAANIRRHALVAHKTKRWHGRIVFRFVCDACGKERWEPEFVAWGIVSLSNYRCSWCRIKGAPRDDGQINLFR